MYLNYLCEMQILSRVGMGGCVAYVSLFIFYEHLTLLSQNMFKAHSYVDHTIFD